MRVLVLRHIEEAIDVHLAGNPCKRKTCGGTVVSWLTPLSPGAAAGLSPLRIWQKFTVTNCSMQRCVGMLVAALAMAAGACDAFCLSGARSTFIWQPAGFLLHSMSPVRCLSAPGPALQPLRGGAQVHAGSPNTISAPPGSMEKEDQSPINPLGAGCRVLVVGASRGIGLEFVRQCLSKGCAVVATVRGSPPAPILGLQSEVGERLQVLDMDVGDEASVAAAASSLAGGAPLTHIIHNAGVYGPTVSLDGKARLNRPAAPKVTKADMLKVFEINSVGPLLVAQNFAPLLRTPQSSKDAGIIAILSSKVGSVDDNGSGGAYAYRASKSACNIIAKSLFNDLRGTAGVFLLHPGYVRTDMTNGNGLIDVEESVAGMLRAIEATDGESPFRWVDYKACLIPW